jgi:hypothetical protein
MALAAATSKSRSDEYRCSTPVLYHASRDGSTPRIPGRVFLHVTPIACMHTLVHAFSHHIRPTRNLKLLVETPLWRLQQHPEQTAIDETASRSRAAATKPSRKAGLTATGNTHSPPWRMISLCYNTLGNISISKDIYRHACMKHVHVCAYFGPCGPSD